MERAIPSSPGGYSHPFWRPFLGPGEGEEVRGPGAACGSAERLT
jgi:hypothetical protein